MEDTDQEEYAKTIKWEIDADFAANTMPCQIFSECEEWELEFGPGTCDRELQFSFLVLHGEQAGEDRGGSFSLWTLRNSGCGLGECHGATSEGSQHAET